MLRLCSPVTAPAAAGSGAGRGPDGGPRRAGAAGLAEELSLYVNNDNGSARATYRRCGFEEVGSFKTVLL